MPQELTRDFLNEMKASNRTRWMILAGFSLLVITLFFISLMVGSSDMPFGESFMALFGQGSDVAVRIVQKIRLPETLAALIAGAGLSIAGLMMQSTLKNPMASPSALGVSNAAVFGANVSIIGFAGGFLATGINPQDFAVGANPFATSSI
ncbi:MAG: iron chelate uptake ABC transporter family permease subunit, partial [Bacilli bacterium]|nr:iron chelate uptake ABC transporter family permease subunit [Bacilli bacterium]